MAFVDPEDRTLDLLAKTMDNDGFWCIQCKHLHLGGDEDPCVAFPDGIPDPLLTGEECHTKPYPGDRGITFKAKT